MTTQGFAPSDTTLKRGAFAVLGTGIATSVLGGANQMCFQKAVLNDSAKILKDLNFKYAKTQAPANTLLEHLKSNKVTAGTLKEKIAQAEEILKTGKSDAKSIIKQALKYGTIGMGLALGVLSTSLLVKFIKNKKEANFETK